MTEDELRELLDHCPRLYHMAERDSWSSIESEGLLSTSALLDMFSVLGSEREQIEARRRPASVTLSRSGQRQAVIRDQLPMDDKGLTRCLQDGLAPEDWYRLLNSKVFFWLTRGRLTQLLNAGTYRTVEHDVIEVDADKLVKDYRHKITLCPINSGCTKPYPRPRGYSTFLPIADYPYASWKAKRKRGERVVELAIDYAIPNIVDYAVRVTRMKGQEELSTLWER